MILELSLEEQRFIVDKLDTDLLLTEAGVKLVEQHCDDDGSVAIDLSESEHHEFIADLREEVLWKSQRLKDPRVLVALARRLLPDFELLRPHEFC